MAGQLFDPRILAFAVGFPFALGAAFAIAAGAFADDVPRPMAVRWGPAGPEDFAAFDAFRITAFGTVAGVGIVSMAPAALTVIPAILRRVLLGAGVAGALFAATLFAATLMGQVGLANAAAAQRDQIVTGLGSGLAVALGVTVFFVFVPDAGRVADTGKGSDAH